MSAYEECPQAEYTGIVAYRGRHRADAQQVIGALREDTMVENKPVCSLRRSR
jgi:hypothetical protein